MAEQCWVHGKAAALRNVQTLISEKYKKIKQKRAEEEMVTVVLIGDFPESTCWSQRVLRMI